MSILFLFFLPRYCPVEWWFVRDGLDEGRKRKKSPAEREKRQGRGRINVDDKKYDEHRCWCLLRSKITLRYCNLKCTLLWLSSTWILKSRLFFDGYDLILCFSAGQIHSNDFFFQVKVQPTNTLEVIEISAERSCGPSVLLSFR